ncbi:transcription initiation factor TFIID subunit 12 isoform 5-T5 [Acridotheres tristis]
MRAGGRTAPGALVLALALLRRCLLLGPLGLRSAGAQDGNGCGHTLLTPHSGTLSSKNYPGTYPNHTMCCWQLQAPPGTSLLLAFGDVDLEPSEHCALSSLLLTDPQTGTAYGPYCRNTIPSAPLLVTNSSTVTVLFNSTSHRSGRGLLLSYATSQHPDLVSCLVRGTHYTREYVSVYCPAGCKDIHGDIWGNPSQGYRDTSVLCKAAVHAGVIADELGGQVTLSREKGITLYESAFANGLRSKRGSLSEKRLMFHKACDDVLEVVTFNASSWWHEVGVLGQDRAWVAERAALSTTGHSWAAEPDAQAAWLELDLGTRRNVTGIITKGSSEQHDYYVTSYHVSSSRDGKNWRPYRGSSGQEEKLIGLDPHNPKKKQDLDKLYDLKAKAQQIMNQFGPSTLINLSNFSSIKPEPASTPPQSSMANSTTVAKMPGTPSGGGRLSPESNQVLTKKKLQDLVREVDPNEQLDEDVEEMLLQIADDFIESVVTAACQLARHRKSNTLEVKDVQLHLERQWNMWIPGFGSEEIRPYKKACTTEAHKQRMALIRKTTKK